MWVEVRKGIRVEGGGVESVFCEAHEARIKEEESRTHNTRRGMERMREL
jgi:hypothetical protein